MLFKDAALVCECCRKRVEVSALGLTPGLWRGSFWRHVRSLACCGQHVRHVDRVDSEPAAIVGCGFHMLDVCKNRLKKKVLNEATHCKSDFMMRSDVHAANLQRCVTFCQTPAALFFLNYI